MTTAHCARVVLTPAAMLWTTTTTSASEYRFWVLDGHSQYMGAQARKGLFIGFVIPAARSTIVHT